MPDMEKINRSRQQKKPKKTPKYAQLLSETEKHSTAKKTAKFFRILPWLLLPLTPIFLTLSYPKFTYSWLAWIALAPFSYFVLKAKSRKQAFWGSFLCGFLSYLGLLYWVYPTMRAGEVPVPFAVLGLVLLCCLMSLDFIITGAFGFFVRRTGTGAFPLLFSSAWVSMEWIKIIINLKAISFPWFILAYSQWEHPEFMQISSIIGSYGLSWAICFTGTLLTTVILRKEAFYKKILGMFPAFILIGGLFIYGKAVISPEMQPQSKTVSLDVAILQPCISLYDKWNEAKEAAIAQKLTAMAAEAKGKDLVLWPENALPGWIDDPKYSLMTDALAKIYKSNHILGSVSRGDGKRVAAFLITPDGPGPDYHKRILVPFGEYVPMRSILGKYISTIAMLGEFKPGVMKQHFMQLKDLKIAPTICYESIFPFLYSSDADRGADIFVNLTNDGWYLETSAPYQHLAALTFRAVETRRPILRAANNGISAVINDRGVIEKYMPLNEEGTLNTKVQVPQEQPKSIYVQYGNLFTGLCLMLCLAFTVSLIFM